MDADTDYSPSPDMLPLKLDAERDYWLRIGVVPIPTEYGLVDPAWLPAGHPALRLFDQEQP